MKTLIQKIPEQWEPFFIIALTMGYSIYLSSWWIGVVPEKHDYTFTNLEALSTIIYEVVTLGCFAWVLKVRGWKKEQFGIEISWLLTGAGLLLFLVDYFLYNLVYALLMSLSGGISLLNNFTFSNQVAFPVLFVMILTNSVFEELIVSAYLVTSLSRHHDVFFVIGFSMLVRILYHTYQGPVITTSIVPMGILFAFVYWKWRKLWPLVFAHSLWNLLAFTYTQ